MSKLYDYQITAVHDKVMDVLYTALGRDPFFASVPIPRVGEGLEAVIHAHGPTALWEFQDAQRQTIEVGTRGSVVAPSMELTPEQIKAQFIAAIQARLDGFAALRGYDGILSACTYATSTIERFRVEGQRAVELRDATWAAGYAVLAEVEAGARPMPQSFAEVEPLLPVLTWA